MKIRVLSTSMLALFSLCGMGQQIQIHLHDGSSERLDLKDVKEINFTQSLKTPSNLASMINLDLSTDSAAYKPGSKVHFRLEEAVPPRARVRYTHLEKVLADEPLETNEWEWKVPDEDFRGYLVQVYKGGEQDTILGTIAVDVSSDWSRFPRYGFVATFGADKTESLVESEMEWLNRCHINGVQFQDWHYKHHWPWGGTAEGTELETYTDIANRTIYTSSVKNYIEAQHKLGMKSIFYNLCYGVLDDAAEDGVRENWYIYKDKGCHEKDYHDLPDSWKSDIYLVNPRNATWQAYLANRNEEVYSHLDFDGFQVDQLGNRGTRYLFSGNEVNMPESYSSFLKAMKKAHPEKRLVMNAVSSYGSKQIAQSGTVDFLYNEVWDSEGNFSDLYDIVMANQTYGEGNLQTVFAAYMNYKMDNSNFNQHGVLLTDAVMFALGASHLELGGDHMLCREYFPYSGLKMDAALKTRIIRYYDFLTAYENVLRDGGTLSTEASYVPEDVSGRRSFNAWPPQLGNVTSIARLKDERIVLHLLNFTRANSLSWRDQNGSMPRPTTITKMPLRMSISKEVEHVYVASPDVAGGALQEIEFELQDGQLTFTLPSLTYWTMVILD